METHSSTLAWKIPNLVGYSPWGRKESDMTEQITHTEMEKHNTPGLGDLPYCPTLAADSLCGCGQVTSLP